jgi:hypothetical protein
MSGSLKKEKYTITEIIECPYCKTVNEINAVETENHAILCKNCFESLVVNDTSVGGTLVR